MDKLYITGKLAAIMFLLVTGTLILNAQSARQYFRAGEEFFGTQNYRDAIEQYSKAIDLDPDFDKAYIQRALCFTRLKDYEKAAADFVRAIVFNDKDAGLFYFAGQAYHLHGKDQMALTHLDRAIELKSNYLEAFQVRSEVYYQLERYQEALEDCKRCLKLKEDERGFYNLAQVYEKLGMYPEAEMAYRNSIGKNRTVVGTHYALASMLHRQGNQQGALQAVQQVLQLEPKNLEGLILQSQVLAAQGNYPRAIEALSLASIDYPREPSVFLNRGDFYMLMNQGAFAVIDYSRVLELDPEFAQVYYKRAEAYEAIMDYEKALKDYERLLAMSKYDGTAQQLHEQATLRMFELNREDDRPQVTLLDPRSNSDDTVDIP
ncbi:MAG: tetratricopeptide repeat protein, partial [Bacteroidetes bacterium]